MVLLPYLLECGQVFAGAQHVPAVRVTVGFLRSLHKNAWFDQFLLIVFADLNQLEPFSFPYGCIF